MNRPVARLPKLGTICALNSRLSDDIVFSLLDGDETKRPVSTRKLANLLQKKRGTAISGLWDCPG